MAGFESLIPAIEQAQEKYRETQSLAFLEVGPTIGGALVLKPMTPQMFIELAAAGNPYVGGGRTPSYPDLVQILWRCSENFERRQREPGKASRLSRFFRFRAGAVRPFKTKAWNTFIQIVARMDYVQSVIEVDKYVCDAWTGQPHWSTSHNAPQSAGVWPAMIVHTLASAYGWTDEKILNTPFRLIWQYMHRIMESSNPEYRHVCTESMEIRASYLRQSNAKNHARN